MLLSITRLSIFGCCLLLASVLTAQEKLSRAEKLQLDRERVESEGRWLYNDLPAGFTQAKASGKPLMVVLRCVPCEECVKLDDDLVDKDPVINGLLNEFVCVRQVSTNGLDLNIFQYDTDQSFAVFFLNGDGTVYGRFGTRSHRTEWLTDVSLEGMQKAMRAALALHNSYPQNAASLAGKQGTEPDVTSPEQYPALRDKYTSRLKSGNDLVKSCIHCHQIGDAQREYYWQAEEPVPERVIFQYPHPKSIGLVFDPKQRATIQEVLPNSPAAEAGFKVGDDLVYMAGQPLISMADVQWVLHGIPASGAAVAVQGNRGTEPLRLQLPLAVGWRQRDDISWRVSSWGLRRIATGGLSLETAPAEIRKELPIADDQMALLVRHVGQYGAHATAKRQGFAVNDIIVSYDGRRDLSRETDLLAYVLRNRKAGDRVTVEYLRDGQLRQAELPIQE